MQEGQRKRRREGNKGGLSEKKQRKKVAPGNRGGRGRGFKVGEKKGAGSRGCASDVVFTTSFPR